MWRGNAGGFAPPAVTNSPTQKDAPNMDEPAEMPSNRDTTDDGSRGAAPRRRFLAALLAGGAASFIAPVVADRAGAATDGSPEHRSPEDNKALNAALEREIRMTATLAAAVAATTDQEFQSGFQLIHDHHLSYAQALRGYLGPKVDEPGNTTPLASPAGTTAAISGTLAALEDETVAIHLGLLSTLKGIDAATLVASIVTTEARHGAALALVSGKTPGVVAAQ